jgi:hypothetical protein
MIPAMARAYAFSVSSMTRPRGLSLTLSKALFAQNAATVRSHRRSSRPTASRFRNAS